MSADALKKALGHAVVDEYVQSGMKLGLGTGSTAVWAVRRLAEKMKSGRIRDVLCVPTSSQTALECQTLGLPLVSLNDLSVGGRLDLTFDGADEVDGDLNLTKGGGGALLIEKIVAYASARMVVMIDERKIVDHLGLSFPVPAEVLDQARVSACNAFMDLGASPELRMAVRKMGPVITDNGNLLVDLRFSSPFRAAEMESELSRIPGVLGNGIFSRAPAIEVLVGRAGGRIDKLRR